MTETKIEMPNKPLDRITTIVNGQPREVFMSGGLLRNIVPYYMEMVSVGDIFKEPEIQNHIVVQMLRPRSVRGQPIEAYTIDDFEMGTEEMNSLIGWATEHALFHFIESVTTAHKLGQKNAPALGQLTKLMESLTGSQDSTEPKQSATPSEPSPVI